MESICVELVDYRFLIQERGSGLRLFFEGYESKREPDFFITVTDEEIRREEIANSRNGRCKFSPDAMELGAIQRKIVSCLSSRGILLFHGSGICVDGRTYIFTAPSGTGKSTHSRLWRKLLREPGKEGLGCNMSAPVEAICCISQGTENIIREATPEEMYPVFYEQSFRPLDKEGTENHLHNLDVLTRSVRLYKLECNMSLDAARLSYETMAGKFTWEKWKN